jgi:hypothetical protein
LPASARTRPSIATRWKQTIAESDQLIKTFNAILMISRLEAGYSTEALAKVDLAAASATWSSSTSRWPRRPASPWKRRPTGPAVTIDGNRELIAQALSNIVDNAIKYSPALRREAARRGCPEKQVEAANPRCPFRDNGPGIPDAADRQRATERFVRLEKSRSQPGSGLGLSLAKAIMKFHGGRLDLARDPGLSVAMSFPGREADDEGSRRRRSRKPAGSAPKFAPAHRRRPFRPPHGARATRARRQLADLAREAEAGLPRLANAALRGGRACQRSSPPSSTCRHSCAIPRAAAPRSSTAVRSRPSPRRLAQCGRNADYRLTPRMKGKLKLPTRQTPGKGSGWIVLGMGKLGARELNFSSDIDLVVFFDPEAPAILDPTRRPTFSRADAAAGAHPAGSHRARLCLPHRSAAAARSRLDAAGDPGRGGADLLRERRARTGSAPP